MNTLDSLQNLRRLALPGALATATLLAGCGVGVTHLNVSDDSHAIGSVRAVKRLGSGPGGPGLEVEASRAVAKGTQLLTANDAATLNQQTVLGPATLSNDARVEHVQLVYNHLLFAGRPVELEWFVGATQVRTHWSSTSSRTTDPQLTSSSTWSGPVGGALGRLHLAPMLSLEARYSGAVALGGRVDSGQRNFTEVALAFRPAPVIVLRGGYAESRTWVRPETSSTELSVRARGPFFNLGLEF